jgi:hypothetical protein
MDEMTLGGSFSSPENELIVAYYYFIHLVPYTIIA